MALLSISAAVEQYSLSDCIDAYDGYQFDNGPFADYFIEDDRRTGVPAVYEPYKNYRIRDIQTIPILSTLGLTINTIEPRPTPIFLRM
jgi:hypothetical protein